MALRGLSILKWQIGLKEGGGGGGGGGGLEKHLILILWFYRREREEKESIQDSLFDPRSSAGQNLLSQE